MPLSKYPFPPHNPYLHIENFLVDIQGHANIASAIDLEWDHIQSLKNAYNVFLPDLIDYNNILSQNAYMLNYFPLYIETIAHVLSRIPPDTITAVLSNDMDICIYGGGAIPEYFGFLQFINTFYQNDKRISFHIFDMYDWSTWRNYLVNNMTPDYGAHHTPDVTSYPLDFCSLDNDDAYDSNPIIKNAKLHIFQNCLTEFIRKTGSIPAFRELFSIFLHNISFGSIVIFINIVNFDRFDLASGMDVQERLSDIENCFKENDFGVILHQISRYDPYVYQPNVMHHDVIHSRVSPRSESKYHTLVLKKMRNVGEIYGV